MGAATTDLGFLPPGRRVRPWRKLGRFDAYLLRGVAGPFAGLLGAVTIALLLERALRLIHELAAAQADIGYFLPLLLQLVPYYLELAVPLAFMVALAMLVARLDERLELEAMLASGLSLSRIAAPLVAFGIVLAGLALVAGGWLEPHGRHGFRTMKAEAINAGRIGALQPLAVFQPSENLAVTFDEQGPDGGAQGIFLWQKLPEGDELAVSGASGRVGLAPGERLFGIDFAAGRFVAEGASGEPYTLDFRNLAFRETLAMREASWQRGSDVKELTVSELLAGLDGARLPRGAVELELFNRLARVLLIPLVPLIVLPLAFATKKGSRTLGVCVCGAFVATSRHLVGLARNFAEMGTGAPAPLLLGTVAALAALVALLFASARKLPSHSPIHGVLNPVAKAFGKLAPKARTVPGLRGHLLTGYVAWELVKWTLLALLTCAAFLLVIDLVEQGDVFVARSFGPGEFGRYSFLRLPALLQQAAPIAALAGAMAAFALLASRHEITVMRAAGLSQWRLLAKAAPASLLLLGATFALAEWALPSTQLRLATWWAETEPADQRVAPRSRWFRIGRDIVRAAAASPDGAMLRGVQVFRRDAQGRLAERIVAERAIRQGGNWSLQRVQVTRFAEGGLSSTGSQQLAWNVPLEPVDVAAFFADAGAVSAAAARRALARAAPVSGAQALPETRLYRTAAEPLAPFVMLLLALPLAFVPPRGRTWPRLIYAGAAGLVYLVGDGVMTVAAQVGYVPSMLGAWAAPALAVPLALTVLLYSER